MKRLVGVLSLLLIALAGCRSKGFAQSLNFFREIKIERQTLLLLGGKMPAVTDFCNWNGLTCDLKPGTFGGTKNMSLSTTKSGLISQFHFYYGVMSTQRAEMQINDFTRRLGTPVKDSTVTSGAFVERTVKWSDSATTFEYCYKIDHKQDEAEASAALLDNSLAATAPSE